MEKDLEILKKIFTDMKYSDTYVGILLSLILDKFEQSGIDEINPHFIYSVLLPEEGRKRASDVADYFAQMKSTGSYKTELQKHLDKLS